ncbi:diacylglycerol kinase [Methylophilaceae bacterium]|jgi:diacylglycerol kinase (ATP)|nr:diacylglycerol kinase [Methylophilaceae bacterium]|tara:strand:- start:384 stop:755 length:372 start_codon:yes stop_codon:yes gene_type:complete
MENQFKNKTFSTILIDALKYSIDNFQVHFKSEKKIRQEIYLAIILIPLGFLIGETAIHKLLLISSVLIMVSIELLNPALQVAVDTISFENINLVRYLKKVGNVTVFFATTNLYLTWFFILFSF